MENYKQRKKIERIVKLSVVFFVALFCVAVFSFVRLGEARRKDAEYNELIARLEVENNNVHASLESVRSGDYLEVEARNRLGMIKGDETHIDFQ